MEYALTFRKMPTFFAKPVKYLLRADEDFIQVNRLIGKELKLTFLNQKFCGGCGNSFSALFRMGFCRECFFTRPEAGESIIRPELSRAHEGIEDRDLAFEKAYQLQPHVVYLANSAGLKVGVTRAGQKLQRWMDQGASAAIVFAETANRFQAGQIEVLLKNFIADKTPWQRMLKNEVPDLDLKQEKAHLAGHLEGEWSKMLSADEQVYHFEYPVSQYPAKVKSLNFDKQPEITATLQGIKGQYLIFQGGLALNVRGHSGYRVKLSFVGNS